MCINSGELIEFQFTEKILKTEIIQIDTLKKVRLVLPISAVLTESRTSLLLLNIENRKLFECFSSITKKNK